MEIFGAGPFSNEHGLHFLDRFAREPVRQRRQILERIFFQVQDRPYLLGWTFFPEEVVAAAAIVAACLPGSESTRQELAHFGYEPEAILPDGADPELSASALKALLLAAGQNGPWHATRTSPDDAARARQTTDHLAAVFRSEAHGQDQELPLQF
jgi:alpha-glucosidase